MNNTPGTIIVLNGASSSGKTSIVRALQALAPEPFLDAGIDKFLWMLPPRYINTATLWQQVFQYTFSEDDPPAILTIHAAPLGDRLVSGMHAALAALSCAGNHLLVDHVLLEPHWLAECAQLFAPLPAYLVGVRCPLPVLEQRERQRRDRTLGQARAQHQIIHTHGRYDFEVDTSRLSPEACAQAIYAYIHSGAQPSAFRLLFQDKS